MRVKYEHLIYDCEFYIAVTVMTEIRNGGHTSNLSNDMLHGEQIIRANSQI